MPATNSSLASVTARFAARPEGLDELHEALDRFFTESDLAEAPIPFKDRMALLTASGEIAANIVAHACRGLPDAEVLVVLSHGEDYIEARFEDTGIPCGDPEPGREAARNDGSEVPHLGIGLNLARLCVDGLEYARRGGVNHWRLVRRITQT